MTNVERESPGPHGPGWQRDVREPRAEDRPRGLPPKARRGRSAEERAAAERRDDAIAALCDFARLKFLPAVATCVGVAPAVVHGWSDETAALCPRCDQPYGGGSGHGPGFCEIKGKWTQ